MNQKLGGMLRENGHGRPLLRLLAIVCGGIFVALAATWPATAHDPVTVDDGSAVAGATAGPLSAADRDLLVKVRLAGLWEGPAGRMAARKGADRRVREIGTMISTQHGQLDGLVVRAARRVGAELPDRPSAEQQGWLDEMDAASGPEFDQVFVDRLRAAHAKVFPVIADVRATTRNAEVRRFAGTANGFVLEHLTLLESTGLVEYPTAAPPRTPVAATPGNSRPGILDDRLGSTSQSTSVVAVLALLLVMVALLLRQVLRRRWLLRPPPRPPRSHVRPPSRRPEPVSLSAPRRPSPYDPPDDPPRRRLQNVPRQRP